jgi:hypothetical protein
MWGPRSLTTLWAFTACYSDSFTLTFHKRKCFRANISCGFLVSCIRVAWPGGVAISKQRAGVYTSQSMSLSATLQFPSQCDSPLPVICASSVSVGKGMSRSSGQNSRAQILARTPTILTETVSNFSLVPPDECRNGTLRSFSPYPCYLNVVGRFAYPDHLKAMLTGHRSKDREGPDQR